MDSPLPSVLGAVAGLPLGWVAASFQHLLYRERDYREHPLRGRRALVARGGLAIMFATCFAVALRPDHYDLAPAALTAGWTAVLLTLASTDFERRRIPNRLIYPSLVIAAALALDGALPPALSRLRMGLLNAPGVSHLLHQVTPARGLRMKAGWSSR